MLDAITDQVFQLARRDSRHEPLEAYAFDALIALADRAKGTDTSADLAPAEEGDRQPAGGGANLITATGGDETAPRSGALADTENSVDDARRPGGDPGILAGAGSPAGGESGAFGRSPLVAPVPPSRWSNPRYLALLRVDAAALRRGGVEGKELCEIAGIGPVPVSVARDLLGQAIVKLVITDGVDVANVTHLGRGPTIAQKIALMWTNPICIVEGCNRRRIEYDHQKPWAQTRHTRLDELDPLCGFHHDLKTRLGWALVPGKGKRAFLPPEDPRHPRRRAGPDAGAAPSAGQLRPASAVADSAATPPSRARRGTRRRAAANAQTTLPDPPGDPPQAA